MANDTKGKPWLRYQNSDYGKPWLRYQQQQGGPDFMAAVSRLIKREGGYVNDPEDRGGETKYGISKAANPDVDIPSLTVPKAASLYRERYWNAIEADKLPPHMREIAFDAAVNQGVSWTKEALKQAGGDVHEFFRLRAQHYANIVSGDPSQAKFARGWEKRLEEMAPSTYGQPWLRYRNNKK